MPDPVTPENTRPPETPLTPEADLGDRVTLTVNKETRTLTPDEVKAAAQKYLAGEDKFRDADRKIKEWQEEQAALVQKAGLADQILALKGMKNPEEIPGAYQRILKGLGLPDNEIEEIMAGITQPDPPETGGGGKDPSDVTPREREMLQLLQEQKRELQEIKAKQGQLDAEQLKQMRAEFKAQVEGMLDSDEILGKISKKPGKRSSQLKKILWQEVEREARANSSLGPEDVAQRALTTVRSLADDLGILDPAPRVIPGAGPSVGLSPTFSADKPPERKPITDSQVGENVLAQLAYEVAMRSGN